MNVQKDCIYFIVELLDSKDKNKNILMQQISILLLYLLLLDALSHWITQDFRYKALYWFRNGPEVRVHLYLLYLETYVAHITIASVSMSRLGKKQTCRGLYWLLMSYGPNDFLSQAPL